MNVCDGHFMHLTGLNRSPSACDNLSATVVVSTEIEAPVGTGSEVESSTTCNHGQSKHQTLISLFSPNTPDVFVRTKISRTSREALPAIVSVRITSARQLIWDDTTWLALCCALCKLMGGEA